MQEQEREMMLRQEQTKQQYMQQHPMYPGAPMYNPYYPPGAYGAPPGSQPGKILFAICFHSRHSRLEIRVIASS